MKKKSIAQILHHKEFPLKVRNNREQIRYYENEEGRWYKREYDSKGNEIFYTDLYGRTKDRRT